MTEKRPNMIHIWDEEISISTGSKWAAEIIRSHLEDTLGRYGFTLNHCGARIFESTGINLLDLAEGINEELKDRGRATLPILFWETGSDSLELRINSKIYAELIPEDGMDDSYNISKIRFTEEPIWINEFTEILYDEGYAPCAEGDHLEYSLTGCHYLDALYALARIESAELGL